MKAFYIFTVITLISVVIVFAKTSLPLRVEIDHQQYVDQAIKYISEKHAEIDPTDLSFTGIEYRFDFEDAISQRCGPNGFQLDSSPKYRETLAVNFIMLDSSRKLENDGRKASRYKGIIVNFPTSKVNEWSIDSSTLTIGDAFSSSEWKEPESRTNRGR